MPYILPLTSLRRTDLSRAGGKGANLGELLAAGLPVPPGFCVLTGAYLAFVADNGLEGEIQRQCAAADAADPAALEAASSAIRTTFEAGKLAGDLAEEIRAAYCNLSSAAADNAAPLPVAVRSSATAEDLPDLSFAGQQDTYLNVVGEQALLRAVVRCWASLWTARAIGYRARNAISQADVALAVVVQVMIPSEAAGVLFTANPLSGRRDQVVIDATLGLGEALVAGKVEPDHYVVEKVIAAPAMGQGFVTSAGDQPPWGVRKKYLGAKALSIRGQSGGGTQTVSEAAGDRQALPDPAILALAALGRQAAAHFGGPQDMEWSWAGEKMWIVQSRPVTSLFPLPTLRAPAGEPEPRGPDHLLVLFNFGTFQGVMDPITPLGRDTFFYLFSSMAGVFGAHWTPTSQTLLLEAGERLFLDLNGLMRHPLGRRAARAFLPAVEPASAQALAPYWDDPRLAMRAARWDLRTRLRLVRALGPNVLRVITNLLFPAARRRRITAKTEQVVQTVHAERIAAEGNSLDPVRLIVFVEQTLWKLPPRMLLWLISMVVSGQAAYQGLRRLAGQLPDSDRLGLEVMRGLEHNVTTEMDLALWTTAQAIRRDPAAAAYFQSQPARTLAADYQAGRMPPAAQSALAQFMGRYGVRGVGEIDLGRRRWREDPTPVVQALISYLKIDQPEAAPEAVFARGAESGRRAVEQISTQLRRGPGGWWKAPLARWLAGRVRELAGLRETPKFTIIRVLGEIRTALLAAGAVWAQAGWLERAQDVCFLRIAELKQLALVAHGTAPVDNPWRALVDERRAAYQREQRRRQVPRLVIGDGTTIYEGMGGTVQVGEKVLVGSPVSPGLVEGVAHVVLDPFSAQLAPGEILVCPGTDPAWTPLFLAAGGLVMEVGGLMTHGSVVAREYGIPAVVGVGQATQRLTTGTRIRVDGSSGTVTILD